MAPETRAALYASQARSLSLPLRATLQRYVARKHPRAPIYTSVWAVPCSSRNLMELTTGQVSAEAPPVARAQSVQCFCQERGEAHSFCPIGVRV